MQEENQKSCKKSSVISDPRMPALFAAKRVLGRAYAAHTSQEASFVCQGRKIFLYRDKYSEQ